MRFAAGLAFVLIVPAVARAQAPAGDEAAELAKKLSNPVASLISVPFQNNWDYGLGTTNASKYTLNFQPVVPITLNEKWNLIARTIIPYVSFGALSPTSSGAGGLGDTVQSFFLSPKEPTNGGWIVGVGPGAALSHGDEPLDGLGQMGGGTDRRPPQAGELAGRTVSSRTGSGRTRDPRAAPA
jgi:hypothetical protein